MSPCGQRTPSPARKLKCCTARLTPSAVRWPISRPSSSSTTSGSTFVASRSMTVRSATSTVAATGWPSLMSNQPRNAPRPSLSSNGSATCWRSAWTSARGRLAYAVPLQRRQSPWRASSGWVKRPITLKRSPQPAGGVASRRRSCRRSPLRTTSCTSVSTSGAARRCSSVQRSVPPRITNSCWAKNQSAAALPLSAAVPPSGSPATKMRPLESRRTSSCAPSISNCSKRSWSENSDRSETAASTRGRRSAGRWSAPSSTTSCSSSVGTQPLDRTAMLPMRTGTPSAWLARASIGARHCWMCGRIAQWSASHAISNRLHAEMTSPSNARASQRRRTQRATGSPGGPGTAVTSRRVVAGGIKDMKISVRQPKLVRDRGWQWTRRQATGRRKTLQLAAPRAAAHVPSCTAERSI